VIRATYHVECDGPCGEYLMAYEGAELTSSEVARFRGERAARQAAETEGWKQHTAVSPSTYQWLCPACRLNPLDIKLPSWQITNGVGT